MFLNNLFKFFIHFKILLQKINTKKGNLNKMEVVYLKKKLKIKY